MIALRRPRQPRQPRSTSIRQSYVLAVMANVLGWRRVAELGVRTGATAELMLRFAPSVDYVGIDAWAPIVGDPDEPGFSDYGKPDMAEWKRRAHACLRPYGARARLIEARTIDAAAMFDAASFDAVFVDADHRYAHVAADIDAWAPLIRAGGWLTGHDWIRPSVRSAVIERYPHALTIAPNCWGVQL